MSQATGGANLATLTTAVNWAATRLTLDSIKVAISARCRLTRRTPRRVLCRSRRSAEREPRQRSPSARCTSRQRPPRVERVSARFLRLPATTGKSISYLLTNPKATETYLLVRDAGGLPALSSAKSPSDIVPYSPGFTYAQVGSFLVSSVRNDLSSWSLPAFDPPFSLGRSGASIKIFALGMNSAGVGLRSQANAGNFPVVGQLHS